MPIPGLQADVSWQAQASRQLERALNTNPYLLLELDRPELDLFYRDRDYRPLWSDENGRLQRADELIDAISRAAEEGLNAAEYFQSEINRYIDATSIGDAIRLEMWLSAALYRYANDRYAGRLHPFVADPDWHIPNSVLYMSELLARIAGRHSIKALLDDLSPVEEGYRELRQELHRHRDIAAQGGWGSIRMPLEPGMRHAKVSQLRHRLEIEGDLVNEGTDKDSDFFDDALAQAVRRYQRRHGIRATGRLDTKTLGELNVSVEDRIEQIRINMERWRWLPRILGQRYIAINMTGFELVVINEGLAELTMPVIIGKQYRETPALSGIITSFEYNPYWTLTKRVMWEKFIPGQIRDANYLGKRSIRVYKGWADAEEVDPVSVDWTALDPENNSPYWMRQEPGPGNALGSMKFLFSNPYQIYLHGTPEKHLFNHSVRAFSHGCIRVKDPATLAATLLGEASEQGKDNVEAKIRSGVNEKVFLPEPVPIYLMYWTAWVDSDGVLNFRDDIYGRDTLLHTLLSR